MSRLVVIVDDDVMNLKMAGRILQKSGMDTVALSSGEELLEYMAGGRADLILLDIMMPGLDGFETFRRLRAMEDGAAATPTPVMFLTADEDISTEARGFDLGVDDYIRKPIVPDVLVKRVEKVIGRQEVLSRFRMEATIDGMTGFLNKTAATERFKQLCSSGRGYLMMLDIDSFKLVNDLYGHDAGDEVLRAFARRVKELLTDRDTVGRMGGDEFTAFCVSLDSEEEIAAFTASLNSLMMSDAKQIMGEDMEIPLGVSIGAVYADTGAYEELIKKADKALYTVKQNGKHGYALYSAQTETEEAADLDLKTLSKLLDERNITNSALELDRDSFVAVYRFVVRYILRYNRNACKVLFSLSPGTSEDAAQDYDDFTQHVCTHLRKSDLVMRYRKDRVFVILTDIKEDYLGHVMDVIMSSWNKEHTDGIRITYETEIMNH